MWPLWCGRPASVPTSAGSSCPSSTRPAIRSTIEEWSTLRTAWISSGCPSSTRPPRPTSEGSARTPATWPSTSSTTPADPGVDRHPRPICSTPPASRLRPANDPERESRKELPMYDLASYVWALVLAGAIGIPAATCAVLYRCAVAAGVSRREATAVTATTAAVLGGWLVLSGLLARAGVYRQDSGEAVPWLLVAFAVFLIALLLATRIPLVSRILADPGTPARLVLPHTLRVVGVLFLIVMAQGHLPAAFALPAGLGDIAIGVAAPFVAYQVTPSTAPLRLLPLALIPTTAVPLAIALHIVSLRRLGTAAKPEEGEARHLPAAG